MPCQFCSAEITKRVVARDKSVFAFLTSIPITPGHTLIAPVRCVSRLEELRKPEVIALFALREKITAALRAAFDAEGFHFAWNEGAVAGQSIPHLHLHIVPRKAGDTGVTRYEPRKFLYRPGSRMKTPEEELQSVAEMIRRQL